MNAALLKAKFEQIEAENAWDELFYRINLRSDEQEKNLGLSFDSATNFENVEKNRYRNVLPYDQNRVILKRTDGSKSTYINASPLKFPDSERGYILSQGPLPNTADDFWQMVHEQGAEIIIMLSKIMEKNIAKCHTYFPNKDNPVERYEYTECELLSEEVKPHYIVRRIRVTLYDTPMKKPSTTSKLEDAAYTLAERIGLKAPQSTEKSKAADSAGTNTEATAANNKSRVVYHFQYMTWPDFGVPEHTDHFLEFLQHIRNLERQLNAERKTLPSSNGSSGEQELPSVSVMGAEKSGELESGSKSASQSMAEVVNSESGKIAGLNESSGTSTIPPIVCHCSAGIGRTGAFVMIDTILSILERKAKSEKPPPLATAEDLDSSAEDKSISDPSPIENNAGAMECSTVSSNTCTIDTFDKEASIEPELAIAIKIEERPTNDVDKVVAPCEIEEEELSAASKKKMRSEDSQKPRACGKIICSTNAMQKQSQLTVRANGKPQKSKSNTSLNALLSDESDSELRHDTAELGTLCDVVVFMRKYRMGLIQTPQQLRFCWKAIVDWIDSNDKMIAK